MSSALLVTDIERIVGTCDESAARDFIAQRYIDFPLPVQDHLAFAYFKAASDGSSSAPDDSVSACELLTRIAAQLKRQPLA